MLQHLAHGTSRKGMLTPWLRSVRASTPSARPREPLQLWSMPSGHVARCRVEARRRARGRKGRIQAPISRRCRWERLTDFASKDLFRTMTSVGDGRCAQRPQSWRLDRPGNRRGRQRRGVSSVYGYVCGHMDRDVCRRMHRLAHGLKIPNFGISSHLVATAVVNPCRPVHV